MSEVEKPNKIERYLLSDLLGVLFFQIRKINLTKNGILEDKRKVDDEFAKFKPMATFKMLRR